ncbi:MAG: VanZ family protein, partial [Methyloprofundus sp.]|nr:VanZ family protein [Methyloprofundus sp.]
MKLSTHYIKALDTVSLILFCAFIYWLSAQSSLPTPLKFPHQDKVMHLGAYFILTFFVVRAFRHLCLSHPLLLISSLIFSSLYGASDEWHQSFVTGRSSDVTDWLADTLGAVLLLGAFQLLRR